VKFDLQNEKVRLRPLEPDDIELLYQWENDPKVWKVSYTQAPYSKYVLSLYIQNSDKDIYAARQLRLMVEAIDSGECVGAIDLFDFEPYHLRAGLGILIYRESDRGKGYGKAALQLMMTYGFEVLGLKQIYANVAASNTPSIYLFRQLGFIESALKKKWLRRGDVWEDELLFQYLK